MEKTTQNTNSSFVVLNSQFNLLVKVNSDDTEIFMTVGPECLTTKSYPKTFNVLNTQIPGVLKTKCINDGNNPFNVEVLDTELAHLFEHVLIQKISELRKEECLENKKFCGETYWDWYKYGEGTFRIVISASCEDTKFIKKAALFSSKIMEEIMSEVEVDAKVLKVLEINRTDTFGKEH